jgi:hypothetical protein
MSKKDIDNLLCAVPALVAVGMLFWAAHHMGLIKL